MKLPGRWALAWALVMAVGCLPPPPKAPDPEPVPAPKVVEAPVVDFALPTRDAASPYAKPADEKLAATRDVLEQIVKNYTGDASNPWAIGHGLLAVGPEMTLWDGRLAIPFLHEEYAEWKSVGGEPLVMFPRERGPIRIEPHTDLMLKVFMELNLPLDSTYVVQGKPGTLEQLYRHSLWRAYVRDDGTTGFQSMNDSPWALQGLATVAPPGLSWIAEDGKPMTMDQLTDAVVADLHEQTAFMHAAKANGQKVKKERQGIFGYTCGGQHLIQGAAYAVARGFGSKQSRQWVADEVPVLYWRMNIELKIVDDYIEQSPEYAALLLEQRMKFLGHFLETAHKLAALGIYTPNQAQEAQLDRARVELVTTVEKLVQTGVLKGMPSMRTSEDTRMYQLYLDMMGDSAHAIRGIDLSTGAGTIRY